MRDAQHLRAKARELYDDAKQAEYVDDGLLCILEAIQLEFDAEQMEQGRARAARVIDLEERRADQAA